MPGAAPSGRITAPPTCCTRRCAAAWARTWQQKGSLNAPDRLRFDVSQPTPIAKADLAGGGGGGERPHPREHPRHAPG